MNKSPAVALCVMLCAQVASGEAFAQSADELAMQLSNPVAALISVPLQLNLDDGFGPGGIGNRATLNVQPVIPVSLGADWNLISRTILPLNWQQDVKPPGDQSGLGDVVQSVFLSPKAPTAGGWIWGAGPALLLPTGSRDFTLDQWAVGPTAVALKQTDGGWTFGALANHLWGVSNSGRAPDLDATFVQPFVTKALGGGLTVAGNLEATYDWTSSQASVPLNLTVTQVTKIGGQLVSYGGGVRAFLDSPSGGPDWGVRLVFTLLYPR